ncbi:cytochrome p450 72c1 [Perilla frutescens var. hirtella]|nr:cytochrome p450 72c1 [Perilla frutescens var. hirtella]
MDVLTHCSLAITCSIIVLIYALKFLNWIWIRPKKLEKLLRQQGFNGNSYTLLYGDFTEIKLTAKESKSRGCASLMKMVVVLLVCKRNVVGRRKVVGRKVKS